MAIVIAPAMEAGMGELTDERLIEVLDSTALNFSMALGGSAALVVTEPLVRVIEMARDRLGELTAPRPALSPAVEEALGRLEQVAAVFEETADTASLRPADLRLLIAAVRGSTNNS